jgi:phosphoribosyl 1,2-cyclic phosphodiesterase
VRFASLGSGSRGNATLIQAGDTAVLVDCGFSAAEAQRRLGRLGTGPEALAAILVTHEHSDHSTGVARLARRHGLPVWATPGTARFWERTGEPPELHLFSCHDAFTIGDLRVRPFPVPHDAREPSQFVFEDGAHRLALLTDTGSSTPHIEHRIGGVDALLLECNHDPEMLARSRYSPALKRRVGGGFGHLSNLQAASLLERIDCSRLQHLAAMHLSQENNTPELARAALAAALGCGPDWIGVADQDHGLTWRQLA